MKFFIAFALIAAVASAAIIKPVQLSGELAEIAEIVAAIQSPSTDPATAAVLEAMLLDVLGVSPTPVSVGPAIVETSPISVGPAIIETNPISVGPAIIDFPLPDGGVVTAEEPALIVPSPVVVGPAVVPVVAESTPLVQIILNINQAAASESAPIGVSPVIVDQVAEEVYVPGPVNVVDNVIAPEQVIEPIVVVEPTVPGPVNVVDNIVVEPVQVVAPIVVEPVQVVAPIVVEPVIVGTPIIPAPAVVLPEQLN